MYLSISQCIQVHKVLCFTNSCIPPQRNVLQGQWCWRKWMTLAMMTSPMTIQFRANHIPMVEKELVNIFLDPKTGTQNFGAALNPQHSDGCCRVLVVASANASARSMLQSSSLRNGRVFARPCYRWPSVRKINMSETKCHFYCFDSHFSGFLAEVFGLMQKICSTAACRGCRFWNVCGQTVCAKAFMVMLGIGKSRFNTLAAAARNHEECPFDLRYIPRGEQSPDPRRSKVHEFLLGLYEDVAEHIPDKWNSNKRPRHGILKRDPQDLKRENLKHLPAGSINDYFRQCKNHLNDESISRKLFCSVSCLTVGSNFCWVFYFSFLLVVAFPSCFASFFRGLAERVLWEATDSLCHTPQQMHYLLDPQGHLEESWKQRSCAEVPIPRVATTPPKTTQRQESVLGHQGSVPAS